MASVIKSANLFSYGQLWRIGGDADVSHLCGGITSIVLFILIGLLFIVKLVEVFSFQTVFAESSTKNDLIPPLMTVNTNQNNPDINPIMIAFNLQGGSSQSTPSTILNGTTLTASAFYYIQQRVNSVSTITRTSIALEPCTINHFSVVPNVDTKFILWGLDQFTCLPVNHSYEIGGSRGFSKVYKAIEITVQCATATCNSSIATNYVFPVVMLDTEVNPSNASTPTEAYATPFQLLVQSGSFAEYTIGLELSTVNTDSSIAYFSNTNTHQSTKVQGDPQGIFVGNTVPKTTLLIQYSGTQSTHDRIFLGILDALAFAGGIFESIMGIFFFMAGFGQLVYEMEFVVRYFKVKQMEKVNFFSYLKQTIYGFLQNFNKQPKWEDTKKEIQLQKTITNLMDIIYLQRRIQFLQKAIQVLFERHQLKGLFLAHHITQKEADQNFKKHKFKTRVLTFLKKRYNQTGKSKEVERKEKQKLSVDSRQVNNNFLEIKLHPDEKGRNEGVTGRDSAVDLNMIDLHQIGSNEWNQDLSELDQGEIQEELLIADLSHDLRLLFEEGQQRNRDPTSRKIIQLIDSKLRNKLRMAIQEDHHEFIQPHS